MSFSQRDVPSTPIERRVSGGNTAWAFSGGRFKKGLIGHHAFSTVRLWTSYCCCVKHGSVVGNLGSVEADDIERHGRPSSAALRVPPLGAVWMVPAQ